MTNLETLRTNLAALTAGDRAFAESLLAQAARRGLSDKQLLWVGKLAARATTPAAPAIALGNFAGMIALFDRARAHLDHPAIILLLDTENIEIRLSVAGPNARLPGTINVAEPGSFGGGRFFGRILRDGTFQASRETQPARLAELLAAFAADPAGVAAAHGILTGRCCFCRRKLSDPRSTAIGYGETCAGHYDLPYPTAAEARAFHEAALTGPAGAYLAALNNRPHNPAPATYLEFYPAGRGQ